MQLFTYKYKYETMNRTASYLNETMNSTASYVSGTMNSTASYLNGTMNSTASYLSGTMNSTASYVSGTMNSTASYVSGTMNSTASYPNGTMNSTASYLEETMNSTASYLNGTMNSTASCLNETMNSPASHVIGTMNSTASYVSRTMNRTASYLEETMNSTASYLNGTMNSTASYLNETMNSTASHVIGTMNSTASYVSRTMNSTASYVSETMNSTTSYLNGTMNSTASYVKEVIPTTSYLNETLNSNSSSYLNETYGVVLYNQTKNADIEDNTVLPYISTIGKTVALIGFLANVFTIIVMVKKESRKISVSRLLVVLAVSDSMCLLCDSFRVEHITFNGIEIPTLIGCRIYFWFHLTFALMSHWIIIIISADRLVAVCFYAQASRISTIRNANIAIGVLFCLSGTLVFFLQYNITPGACILTELMKGIGHLFLIYPTLYTALPVPLLIIINSVTVFMLCFKKAGQIKHRNLTSMLLATTALFIILVLPGFVAATRRNHTSKVFQEVAQLMLTVNYGANFLIYVMFGKRFRKNMFAMFRRDTTVGLGTS